MPPIWVTKMTPLNAKFEIWMVQFFKFSKIWANFDSNLRKFLKKRKKKSGNFSQNWAVGIWVTLSWTVGICMGPILKFPAARPYQNQTWVTRSPSWDSKCFKMIVWNTDMNIWNFLSKKSNLNSLYCSALDVVISLPHFTARPFYNQSTTLPYENNLCTG